MDRSHTRSPIGEFGRRAPLVAALIFLVAINLRSPLTTVGPVLAEISADHRLTEALAGLLGALPLLMFAAISPLVHLASTRIGTDRLLLAALVLLAAGVAVRSFGATAGLWAGTVVIGAAIAVGNVLVPVLIRRDYRRRISGATALYSACMGTVAAAAAAVVVPIANRTGWQISLALWALPPLVVALLWVPRARAAGPALEHLPAPTHPPVSVWRQPTAWMVTAFMGLQSTTFYILITWLPTISTAGGFSATQGGLHVFGLQLVGMAAGLLMPRLMRRPDSQTMAAVAASAPIVIGAVGLLSAPALTALWAMVIGAGTGSSLVVALSLISIRGRTQAETTQLSGMAQSLGYLLAAGGPVLAGALAGSTGTWQAPLVLIVLLGVLQTIAAIVAGKDRRRTDGSP